MKSDSNKKYCRNNSGMYDKWLPFLLLPLIVELNFVSHHLRLRHSIITQKCSVYLIRIQTRQSSSLIIQNLTQNNDFSRLISLQSGVRLIPPLNMCVTEKFIGSTSIERTLILKQIKLSNFGPPQKEKIILIDGS